jgi:hypothetical protein
MRPISRKRQLIEQEGRLHAIRRGVLGFLHFENFPFLVKIFHKSLLITSLYEKGRKNAGRLKVEKVQIDVKSLPAEFNGTRILLLTDIHVDAIEGIVSRITDISSELEYDFCILGGDYSFGLDDGHGTECAHKMNVLAQRLVAKSPVYGVLGNHDRYKMAETLSNAGVHMLVNESTAISKGNSCIHLVGVDDSHYYEADDIELAHSAVADGEFRIVVAHSPEPFRRIAASGANLQLSGHTHGGQVCLPGGRAVVTSSSIPYRVVKGRWSHHGMQGYTSRGVGASGVPVRFFCRPEITLITLGRKF